MALVFFVLLLIITVKVCKKLTNNQKIILIIWYILVMVGLFFYTKFLINIGWEYGIPGADMQNYFQAALAINNGKWSELAVISPLYFSQIKFGTLTYFLFSMLTAVLLRIPIVDYQITLYFIYVSFLLICILACINVAKLLGKNKIESCHLFFSLFCFGLIFAAYRLLRDVLLFYIITVTLLYIKNNGKEKNKYISIILMLVCIVMRPYTILIVLPFYMVNCIKSKRVLIYVTLIPMILIFFNDVFSIILPYFNITWNLSYFDTREVINFLLFPNIFNQSRLLLNWNSVPHSFRYVAGCDLPGMYYAMSLWNFFIYPMVFIGVLYRIKDRIRDKVLWTSILMNISIIYSILYNMKSGIETRHKIMILIPLVYFAGEGVEFIRRVKVGKYRVSTIYPLFMFFIALGVFIIC